MRILHRAFEKGGSGLIKIVTENEDDVYVIYNILEPRDIVTSSTHRKVSRETASGSSDSKRLRITISIDVEQIDFDSETTQIRLNGKTTKAHEHVKQGSYQSIDIGTNNTFSIEKAYWDQVHIDALNEAVSSASKSDVGALVAEPGLCNVAVLTRSMLRRLLKIEQSLPKKRGAGSVASYNKNFEKFLNKIYAAVNQHFNFEEIKVVLVGSPGHLSDQIVQHLKEKAVNEGNSVLVNSISKFVTCNTSSGHLGSLYNCLNDPIVSKLLSETKAAREASILNSFIELLAKDPDKCQYGVRAAFLSAESYAIKDLLIVDSLFRTPDKARRRQLVEMVESVRHGGGEVFVLSSLLDSGKRLADMGGVACILKFAIPELAELSSSESESEC
ncbi:hypothetical protein P9112_001918 [Eukaryota sp. TZLM1-RC]